MLNSLALPKPFEVHSVGWLVGLGGGGKVLVFWHFCSLLRDSRMMPRVPLAPHVCQEGRAALCSLGSAKHLTASSSAL